MRQRKLPEWTPPILGWQYPLTWWEGTWTSPAPDRPRMVAKAEDMPDGLSVHVTDQPDGSTRWSISYEKLDIGIDIKLHGQGNTAGKAATRFHKLHRAMLKDLQKLGDNK